LLKNLDLQLQLELLPKARLLDLQVFEALDYLPLRTLLFDTLFLHLGTTNHQPFSEHYAFPQCCS
jgi:hypothetical protein